MSPESASPSPQYRRHGSNSCQPLTRRDGVLKVTGRATYAADNHPADMLYAVTAVSRIARGRVTALDVDAAALLVYRAAWTKDMGAARVTREAAMAKLYATDRAQSVIDKAVQLHGGLGIKKGVKVEELYREIRALRIYEGATEVQKIVIARELLKNQPRRPHLPRNRENARGAA